MKDLSIIMPALNEEKNIADAIENTISAMKDYSIEGEIIVVNDGSTDSTNDIIKQKSEVHHDMIRIIHHEKPNGIGASFWEGFDISKCEIVTMFPGDNENDPWEVLRYMNLLDQVDIIIPFVYNKWQRPLYRNVISFIYRLIINTTFLVNFNYTNGTIMYRKSILSDIKNRNKGFFFQTDILIRLIKRGYLFAEVPYRLWEREFGESKAITFSNLIRVIKGYLRLVKDIYFNPETKLRSGKFSDDSLSLKRYDNKTQSN